MKPRTMHMENRFRPAFQEAHRDRDEPPARENPHWKSRIMAEIREIGPLKAGAADFSTQFGLLVWRLMPVTGVLLALLVIWSLAVGLGTDRTLEAYMLNDPVGFDFIKTLGLL